MSDTISLGFKLTGEADFKRALSDINNELKLNASEMGLVAAKYESASDSTQRLSQKTQILQNAISNEKAKISELKSAIESYSSAHVAAASNIERLKSELASATSKMDDMKSSSDITKKELLAQQAVIKDLAKELSTAEKAYDSTGKNVTKFSTELNTSEKNIITMGKQLKTTGVEGLTEFGNKATEAGQKMSLLSIGIIALGAKSVSSASNLAESQNKVDVAFGDSANAITEWSKTTLDSYGIAQGASLDMAAGFGDMATSMGLPQDEAADMSKTLVGLSGDLASFKNISISEANTALTAIFTGETESLKKLGIVMTEANLKAFALSSGIKTSYESMSEAEKVQLRYNYVMASTTNSQGDFKNTSDGTANSIRTLQQSLEELSATFGEVLLPVVTPIIQGLTDMAKGMASVPEPVKVIIAVIAGLISITGPALIAVGQLSLGLAALSGGFGVAGTSATAAITPIAAVALPIIAIVAASVALGVALAYAGKAVVDNWEPISAFFSDLGNGIVDAFKFVSRTILELMVAPINGIIGLIDGAIQALNTLINGLDNIQVTMPSWLGGGTLGFSIPEIPYVPFISIPAYATGTLNHPGGLALVGENGPEVVNLPRGSKVYPNNASPSNGDIYYVTVDASSIKDLSDIATLAKNQRVRTVQGKR